MFINNSVQVCGHNFSAGDQYLMRKFLNQYTNQHRFYRKASSISPQYNQELKTANNKTNSNQSHKQQKLKNKVIIFQSININSLQINNSELFEDQSNTFKFSDLYKDLTPILPPIQYQPFPPMIQQIQKHSNKKKKYSRQISKTVNLRSVETDQESFQELFKQIPQTIVNSPKPTMIGYCKMMKYSQLCGQKNKKPETVLNLPLI